MVSLASPAGAMPPPLTPLKRPTIGLKRDSEYLDTDDEAALSSSTKKLRVAFDPNVDVRILDDYSDKSFDLVKEEVRQSIERHIAPGDKKDDAQYAKLVQLLNQDISSSEAVGPKLLKKYLLAIDARISSLAECGKLVTAILDLAWIGRDEAVIGLYTKFLCDLASAHSKFVPAIMERLVSYFAKLPSSLGHLPEESPVTRTRMFSRLHIVVKTLLRQIPSASHALTRMFRAEFPNDLSTSRSYMQYQKHLLRLGDHSPELKAEILALIVQRLVNIDVQIQRELEDEEEEAEEKLLQRPSSKDGSGAVEVSDDSDEDSMSESDLTMTEEEQRLRELRVKVAKMDGTLDLLFEYYTPLVENVAHPQSNDAYQQLLSHFSTFILPNRTRHAQFLVFHFSQTSPAHTTLFVQHCMQIALDDSGSIRQRITACAYLASFVARASRVPVEVIREIFDVLCKYLEDMRRRYEPNCRGPDRRTYNLYYAVAQAVIYIFCFKWRDLVVGSTTPELDTDDFNEDDVLAEGRDLAWLPGIKEKMQKNIYCRLNPLKVCSQEIVGEFADIARHIRFLYVFPLLETNKRVRLGQTFSYYGSGGLVDIGRRETALDRKTGKAHHQLETYFPFDPYQLPKSKHWVANDYNEWKAPNGMGDEGDDNDYGETDELGESDDESLPEERTHAPIASVVSVSN